MVYCRYNGPSGKSGMAVLEVNLPTGYQLAVWALQNFVKKTQGQTSLIGAEFNANDGIGVFYFDYVSNVTDFAQVLANQ